MVSPFFDYFNSSSFLVIDNIIYTIKENVKCDKYLNLHNCCYGLQKTEPVSIFLDFNEKDNKTTLVEFVLCSLIGKNISSSIQPKLNLFNEDIFVYFGKMHLLFSLDSNQYTVGAKIKTSLKDYDFLLQKQIYVNHPLIKNVLDKGEYYDQEKDLGVHVHNNIVYVTKQSKPFMIQNQYHFPSAKIGVPLYLSDEISWQDPIVINDYTHPALPSKNKPYQKICCGNFNFNQIRERYDLPSQIKSVLFHAEQFLTKGVWDDAAGAWHRLSTMERPQ
ncbi:MAG: hypothetical protein ABIF40_04855 [archaeon]